MNTEKAIDLLDNLVLMMFEDDYESDYDTALRMAIDALKTQADSDTISRKQAIDALFEILDRPKHADFLYADEIARALNQLPPSPHRP